MIKFIKSLFGIPTAAEAQAAKEQLAPYKVETPVEVAEVAPPAKKPRAPRKPAAPKVAKPKVATPKVAKPKAPVKAKVAPKVAKTPAKKVPKSK